MTLLRQSLTFPSFLPPLIATGKTVLVTNCSVSVEVMAWQFARAVGSKQTLKLYTNIGFDPDHRDSDGRTDLYHAVKQGNLNLVKLLIKRGCDVHRVEDVFPYNGALHVAAEFGRDDIIALLLQHGCALDSKNSAGQTSLNLVAENGHSAVTKLLLDSGSNVNEAKNNSGNTALHAAATRGHDDVLNMLLKHGCDVDIKNSNGKTALYFAAVNGHTAVTKLLLFSGCNVNEANTQSGNTALHAAAARGHEDILNMLLNHACDVDTKNSFGETALYFAAVNGHTAVTKLLLDSGCNVNVVKNKYRDTAVHAAAGAVLPDCVFASLTLQPLNKSSLVTAVWPFTAAK